MLRAQRLYVFCVHNCMCVCFDHDDWLSMVSGSALIGQQLVWNVKVRGHCPWQRVGTWLFTLSYFTQPPDVHSVAFYNLQFGLTRLPTNHYFCIYRKLNITSLQINNLTFCIKNICSLFMNHLFFWAHPHGEFLIYLTSGNH